MKWKPGQTSRDIEDRRGMGGGGGRFGGGTLLGVAAKVRRLQQSNPEASNQAQVAMELQADCLAGVW
jgi:predicted metalloprotease